MILDSQDLYRKNASFVPVIETKPIDAAVGLAIYNEYQRQKRFATSYGLEALKAIKDSENESLLNSFQNLDFNWDGDNALAMGETVISNARNYLNFFNNLNIPPIDIEPTSNGTIIFEWTEGPAKANLEIGKTTFSYYVSIPGEATLYQMGKAGAALSTLAQAIENKIYELPFTSTQASSQLSA